MKSVCTLLLFSFWLAAALAQRAPIASFTVAAGATDRLNTPVSASLASLPAPLPEMGLQLVERREGQRLPVPFAIESGSEKQLTWILSGETPAGTERVFELRSTDAPAASGAPVEVLRDEAAVVIRIGDKPVLQYQIEAPPLPEGVSKLYTRGGFLHPLWSPGGEVLTRIQPPDHYHHVGIWNPWTHTKFQGREIDFWNLNKAEGTVRPVAVTAVEANAVYGGFQALHAHVDLNAPHRSGALVALNETWDVRAWNADPDAKVWLVDFESTLNCATDSPLTIEAYRYQGFVFRAIETWNDGNTELLTSAGKNKANANETRARWCDVRGPSANGKSGILFLTAPVNHNFPEHLRVWPVGANKGKENVFVNFNPAQEKDWVLKPGQTYTMRYRMLVYDGEISAESAERYWQDFANPPHVSVLVHPPAAGKKILIYTKNGEGYVHENRAASVVAIRQLAEANGIEVVASDDPAQFNDAYLQQFDALVFSNTNNATFDTDEQKLAFQRYIQAGGGFVGVHIACGSERQWPWFSQMVGGRFRRHPKLQPFDLRIIDPHHVSTRHLPPVWHWEDECYFIDHLNPDIHVLMAADLNTVTDNKPDGYPGITFGNLFPLSWYHTFDGGRQWYSALGHKTEYYLEPLFLQHLLGGITWAVDHPPLDYSTVTETLLME